MMTTKKSSLFKEKSAPHPTSPPPRKSWLRLCHHVSCGRVQMQREN